MKKLMKSVICGIRKQYTDAFFTMKSQMLWLKKLIKKKKTKRERTSANAAFNTIHTGTLVAYTRFYGLFVGLHV